MYFIVGIMNPIAVVLWGCVFSSGELISLWQLFGLLFIGGVTASAFISANTRSVLMKRVKPRPRRLLSEKYNKIIRLKPFSVLNQFFNLICREGLIATERPIDDTLNSGMFTRYADICREITPLVVDEFEAKVGVSDLSFGFDGLERALR